MAAGGKPEPASKKKEATPLPLGPFAAVSIMYFTNSMSQTLLFPFAAIMVQSFHVTEDPVKLGYYAGFLASACFAGSLLTSSLWGILSDKIGRKPVLMVGLSSNIICALLFGSSQNFPSAIAARFLSGLFSTILATGRSSVAELCDKSNQARAFSLIGTNYGAGLLLGPALGGFLSEPVKKYPMIFRKGGLFDRLPFLLPCLALAGLSLIGLISTLVLLPETLGRAKADKKYRVVEDKPQKKTVRRTNGSTEGQEKVEDGLIEPLLTDEEKRCERSTADGALTAKAEGCDVNNCEQCVDRKQGGGFAAGKLDEPRSSSRFLRVLMKRDTVVSTIMFCALSYTSAAFNEVFPLWCITPWNYGGLSFDTSQIAVAQTAGGLALVPLQLFVYAPLVVRMGAVNALRTATASGFFLMLFPLVRNLGQGTMTMQIVLSCLMTFRSFSQAVSTSIFMLIANSIEDPQYIGAVNGFAQTINMVFRAIAPTASGSLYAWSTSQRGAVLNASFWFMYMAALYALMLVLTCFLSPRANEPKFTTVKQEQEKEVEAEAATQSPPKNESTEK